MSKSTLNFGRLAEQLASALTPLREVGYIQADAMYDFSLPANWEFRNRVNHNYHLTYVRSGDGAYYFGNREEKLTKGKILLISPGAVHSRILNPRKIPHMVLVRFSICSFVDSWSALPFGAVGTARPAASDPASNDVAPSFRPFAFALEPEDKTLFHSLFEQLSRRYPAKGLLPAFQSNIITRIMFELYTELDKKTKLGERRRDPRIDRAERLLRAHPEQAVSIRELAAAAGLSVNYFRELFKKQYGQNPHEYRNEQRLKRAMELLVETDEKVREIASGLGFSDPFAFSKQFKTMLGVSPSFFRLEHKLKQDGE